MHMLIHTQNIKSTILYKTEFLDETGKKLLKAAVSQTVLIYTQYHVDFTNHKSWYNVLTPNKMFSKCGFRC